MADDRAGPFLLDAEWGKGNREVSAALPALLEGADMLVEEGEPSAPSAQNRFPPPGSPPVGPVSRPKPPRTHKPAQNDTKMPAENPGGCPASKR